MIWAVILLDILIIAALVVSTFFDVEIRRERR